MHPEEVWNCWHRVQRMACTPLQQPGTSSCNRTGKYILHKGIQALGPCAASSCAVCSTHEARSTQLIRSSKQDKSCPDSTVGYWNILQRLQGN